MADESYQKTFYHPADFPALVGTLKASKGQLDAKLLQLALSVPVNTVLLSLNGLALAVQWNAMPSTGDVSLVTSTLAAFVGGGTSSASTEVESLAITNTATGSLVDVIDVTTGALDAGDYLVLWDALVGMLATVANTGVRGVITLTRLRSGADVSRQWEHNWTMQQPQLFSGGIKFKCEAGDRVRALLQVQKIGVAAATAQMAVARITIDLLARPVA